MSRMRSSKLTVQLPGMQTSILLSLNISIEYAQLPEDAFISGALLLTIEHEPILFFYMHQVLW